MSTELSGEEEHHLYEGPTREPWAVLLELELLADALGWSDLPRHARDEHLGWGFDLGDGVEGVILLWEEDLTPCRVYTTLDGVRDGFTLELGSGWLSQYVTTAAGLEHGASWQYQYGRPIGRYTLEHGTGLDLWFEHVGVLQEEYHLSGGRGHGPSRWWDRDGRRVYYEEWFFEGRNHGPWREWDVDESGEYTLRDGSPTFWVQNTQVTRAEYDAACAEDESLRPYSAQDDDPRRTRPPIESLSGAPTEHEVILAVSLRDALPEL